MNLALLPQAPVWVLDDPNSRAAGQASAIAGRLGLPFRRLHTAPGQAHRPGGPGPGLVLSAGAGAGLRALLLRSRHGCRVVHCAAGLPNSSGLSGWLPFDLTITPSSTQSGRAGSLPHVIPVLGAPNVVSPALLARARDLWTERLSHLPHPRIALLFGGADPAAALALGRHLARLARECHGCVMVSVQPASRYRHRRHTGCRRRAGVWPVRLPASAVPRRRARRGSNPGFPRPCRGGRGGGCRRADPVRGLLGRSADLCRRGGQGTARKPAPAAAPARGRPDPPAAGRPVALVANPAGRGRPHRRRDPAALRAAERPAAAAAEAERSEMSRARARRRRLRVLDLCV